jgi:2-polyprenyl-6-methoxyphenol hydroxylase-like FAD-dependent oxidoreductase
LRVAISRESFMRPAPNEADYTFGGSIKTLAQNEAGVDVTFERSRPRRFDLVIGADGLHSIVRRLAFGADSEFVRHAGLYAATISLPSSSDGEGEMFMLNTPGKLDASPLPGCSARLFRVLASGIRNFD